MTFLRYSRFSACFWRSSARCDRRMSSLRASLSCASRASLASDSASRAPRWRHFFSDAASCSLSRSTTAAAAAVAAAAAAAAAGAASASAETSAQLIRPCFYLL